MPPADYWESLFDVEGVLNAFAFGPGTGEVAELGCGYGTFTIPLARRTGSVVHAFDIDPEMIETTRQRTTEAGLSNVRVAQRDVFVAGFGLPDNACGACLLFNILHGESPVDMLREAARVVRHGGTIAVIHWRSDIRTPRGPDAGIRPRPEQILAWAKEVEELVPHGVAFLLPPWHVGLRLDKHQG